jgi:circadian clock protein KaiC
VSVLWNPVTEGVVDAVCDRLLDIIQKRGVRRLFIDGIDGFAKLASEPGRVGPLLTALSNELRSRSVTTFSTAEMDLAGIVPGQPLAGLSVRDMSPVADNIVLMRFVGTRSQLHRLIAVLKVRESKTSLQFRRYQIEEGGLIIESDATAAERLLGGFSSMSDGAQALSPAAAAPDQLGRGD